jgi:hypothetical protein
MFCNTRVRPPFISESQKQVVDVDPVALRKAILNFKVTDGLLPSEKVISSDNMKIAMQVIGSSAPIAQAYNIAPLFSYLMKVENVDFAPFEKSPEQMAYEQAMGSWQAVAMEAAKKGAQISTPQPKPADFGWNPQQVSPAAQAQAALSNPGTGGGMTNGAA